jgi:amino acid adenylation domain-containing protein
VYGGNYYVPIDDEMPRFRIDLIFDNLKPRAMICDESTLAMAETFQFDGEIMLYDEVSKSGIDDEALAAIRDRQLDTDPIYIVFTSGSTGIPKGVVACHRSVIDYIENLSDVLGFNEDTRFANQTPLYFDACLKELYPTLKFGATTYIVPKSLFMFPIKLVEFLNEYKINTVCWVVSALTMISSFKTFDKVVPQYLHTIAFGSEVFPIKQFNIWKETLPNAKFTNLYGPTECTGMCCYYNVNRDFALDEVMPVGRPFHNTEILLLNEKNERAKAGEVGEICVRGTSLTLGYYHNFEKTNEAFVQNPLNDRYPELIYRTGDLGKYNEFGELVFVSRKDYQIKHMGHRIELGEIEVNVNMLDGISTSCCVYQKEKGKIVLFYVGEMEVKDLVSTLKDKLPRYMIPNRVEKLDTMPLTANGKLDRVTLSKRVNE